MNVNFHTINDGCGIIGIGYQCPECKRESMFIDYDVIEQTGCPNCGHKETFTDEEKEFIDDMW